MDRSASGSTDSPSAVEPARSQKSTVTTLRYSRPCASSAASGSPHELQKLESGGFSRPQLGQVITVEAYDAGARFLCVAAEVVRAGAPLGRFVVGVQKVALVDREAAAADAGGQAVTQGLEGRDPCLEVLAPAVREALPVAAARRAVRGEAVEGVADLAERDPGGAACLDERDPPQDRALEAALV